MRQWLAAVAALLSGSVAAEMPGTQVTVQGLATPQMFGAAGDGAVDDSTAVKAWLNSGRPLTCTGAFRVDSAVIASVGLGKGLHLQGRGRHLCRIILAERGRIQIDADVPTGRDLNANALHSAPQIVIRDLAIEPAYPMSANQGPGPQSSAALSITFPGAKTGNPGGWTDPMVLIDNLSIMPADAGKRAHIHYGLHLSNVSNADLSNITCEGFRGGPIVPGSACIVYEGDAAPVDTRIRNAHAYFVETGIRLAGTWQGVHILTPTIVAARFGVSASSSDNDSTLLEISGGEINVSDAPILIRNTTRTLIHDVHLNLIGTSTQPDPACIKLGMSSPANSQFSIHDTICEAYQSTASSGFKYGVHISSALPPGMYRTSGFIHGNLLSNAGNRDDLFVPVHLGPGTSDVVVGCNDYRSARSVAGTIWNVENGNPGTNPALLNYLACAPEPLATGISAGGR
ncbi:hypothetical protein JNW90_34590 [Micromonospora sp. STR1s_5]|nr:hypothetical protein [Micromonospora sp. STR1s_5]